MHIHVSLSSYSGPIQTASILPKQFIYYLLSRLYIKQHAGWLVNRFRESHKSLFRRITYTIRRMRSA